MDRNNQQQYSAGDGGRPPDHRPRQQELPSMSAAIPRRPSVPRPPPPPAAPPMNTAIPRRSLPTATSGTHSSYPPHGSSQPPPFASRPYHQAPPPGQQYRGPPPSQYNPPQPYQSHAALPHRVATKPPPPPAAASSTVNQIQLTDAIPRRKAPKLPSSKRLHDQPLSHIKIKSEKPLIVRIKLKGIPMDEGIPRLRSSGRAIKRKRQTYEEMDLTDSDDLMSEEEQEAQRKRLKKGKAKRSAVSPVASSEGFASAASVTDSNMDALGGTDQLYLGTTGVDGIESPPPGVLSNLWYSREIFLNIFVVDKILGWKTRPITKLEFEPDGIQFLDPLEAAAIRDKALSTTEVWKNSKRRMEISRINPTQCPVVLPIAAEREQVSAGKREGENKTPRFKVAPKVDGSREEVLLVKWRGRSYMHCSWERKRDLEKFDASNGTARHKIRRYFQNQEVAMGKNWKKVLEEERSSLPDLHPHDPLAATPAAAASEQDQTNAAPAAPVIDEEELFSPEFLEVERILACDESDMDTKVLARQRGLNIKMEQEALRRREQEDAREAKMLVETKSNDGDETSSHESMDPSLLQDRPPSPITMALRPYINGEPEEPWDPEDNVRYVVKWKGLQYAEMTWDYWRDIKTDAVTQAEDFWYRQRAPDLREVDKLLARPHPHVRDFRKLVESPKFGMSTRPRPIENINGNGAVEDDDDKEQDPGFRLRSYQLEGVNWLLFNWWNKRSCILADEMGLGKTIQTVGFLHQLNQLPATQIRGPFLIVAPLSLIGQWQSESQSWAPDMNVVFYHGSADARDFLAKHEFFFSDQFTPKPTVAKLKKQHVTKFHILITTYEVVLKDVNVLSKIRWKALVVDEAHRLKNPKARLFEELASVPRDFCLLLTGTPLQNSTEELWALLHFSDPKAFASKDEFVGKFGQLKDSKQVSDLHTVLKPYLLRRVKEDVEKSLPPKEETILEVTLTPIQKTYYKAIYERNTAFLYKGSKPSNAPSLMNVMMELRKCCNHPFLVRGAEDRILLDAAAPLKGNKDENGNDVVIDYLKLFGEHLVKSSGKMVLLAKLLPKLKSGGHKVLIFSQMVRVLDLLEELLKMKRYRYERLDGSTSAGARSAAVDRFHRKSAQRFVMLLSTRAGGLGLNLTAADTVIIFDSDWNPQNDLQAMARAHRIGQTRSVRVYRLLTAKTYEMHMFHSASLKLGLDRAVLAHQRQQGGEEGEDSKAKGKSDRQLQAKEIDELLKKGAYDVFRDDDDKEAQQFMETDIDQLLERSSRKVTYGNTNTSISSGLGSFSKASFVAETDEGGKDVDLDDPDFWAKAVGLEAPVETPEEVAAMIDDGVKRNRKQVQVFDPYAAFAEAEQKKKDKAEKKIKEEKEEKKRLKEQKKQERLEKKEREKREREEARGRLFGKSTRVDLQDDEDETPTKESKVGKSKKLKKSERKRRRKRAENEDPVLERLKQAWEVPQKNRATSAMLRFGFDRYCKIRNESNLTSLPIQDLEVFFRSYVYQLALQVAVPLLSMLKARIDSTPKEIQALGGGFRTMIQTWLGARSERETDWICNSVQTVLKMHEDVRSGRRFLRMPLVLADPSYMEELRKGAAFRALRRIALLSRLHSIMEEVLDEIIAALGHEEFGKRGCTIKDMSALDVDLKARQITTEELLLAIGRRLKNRDPERLLPASWWDRSCDLGLIVGTFVHGLGNYESMRNDEDFPFASKIRSCARRKDECCRSYLCYDAAARAARTVFDDALNSAKAKATEEAHQAVAAAVKATKLAEQEGGQDTNKNSNDTSKTPDDTAEPMEVDIISDDDVTADAEDSDFSHYVTITDLLERTTTAFRAEAKATNSRSESLQPHIVASEDATKKSDEDPDADRLPLHKRLPMPDARVLDSLLLDLLNDIEGNDKSKAMFSLKDGGWDAPNDVIINDEVRTKVLSDTLNGSDAKVIDERQPYQGIGFNGSRCGSSHRTLDDSSDYGIGAACNALVHVASGTDSPRYLRAIGVPMNVTRYCLNGLLYADDGIVEELLNQERAKLSEDGEKPRSEIGLTVTGASSEEKEVSNPEDMEKKELAAKTTVMPPLIKENAKFRACLCATALHSGIPGALPGTVASDIMAKYSISTTSDAAAASTPVFSLQSLTNISSSLAGVTDNAPDMSSIQQYVEFIFLPFCTKLCIMGNGPTTLDARGSKGQFETAYGISIDPDPAVPRLSPLPDPTLPLAMHSAEAVACASAILRRWRLLRSLQYIASGRVPLDTIIKFLSGPTMRKDLDHVPLWWCPWIHDLGLLVHAVTHGLFAILVDRHDESKIKETVFEDSSIKNHMYSTFVIGKALPKAILDSSTHDQLQNWIQSQSREFPSAHVIERRLALLASELTADLDGPERYDNVPMFDHGGWPRC